MTSQGKNQVELRVRRLERNHRWVGAATAVLMVALGGALIALYVLRGHREGALESGTYALVVGLTGLIVLFSLYMVLKQRQIQDLKQQLFESAVLQESLRLRLAGVASLFEGISNVGVQIGRDALLEAIAEHTRTSLLAHQSSVMLLDEETRQLRCVAVSGQDADLVTGGAIHLGDPIAGWVAEHNQALALTPAMVAERFPMALKPKRKIVAGLCVPLALPDKVIGVLNVNRLVNGQPFTDEDARLVTVFAAHLAIAIRRVSEREAAEVALKEREELLRQSQRMEALGRLAGGIAHDYNNQLTVILSSVARLLREIPADDGMRPHAKRISSAADRCAEFTRQLLMFGRQQQVEGQVLDLNARVTQMAALLTRLIGENIELVTVLDPELGRVRIDRARIEQALMSLVVNARDALPTGGRLTLETANMWLDATAARAHPDARAGDYVVLSVRDTGFGMDPETQAHVFEPFFSTKAQRTGLGLSMVYGVVQQAEGFTTVESTPGHGTMFRVFLPRVDAPLDPEPEIERLPAADDDGSTILLVEDDASVRAMVLEMLENQGFHVLEASWAGEAVMLNEITPGPIDLLITDVVMPGESGGDLAQWMAKVRPEMPVLYMSGHAEEAIARHGVKRGADFLAKPFTEEDLIARVRLLMDRRRGERPGPVQIAHAA